jgi:hypothetical protein
MVVSQADRSDNFKTPARMHAGVLTFPVRI